MSRKKKHEEHVNHERWLVSYADFITLLFATFTALFAISNADKDKFKKLAESLRNAFTQKSAAPVMDIRKELLKGTQPPNTAMALSANNGSKSADAEGDPEEVGGKPEQILAQTTEEEPDWEQDAGEEEPQPPPGEGAGEEPQPTPEATPTPAPEATPGGDLAGSKGGEGNADAQMTEQIKAALEDSGLEGKVEVRQDSRGMVISMGEAGFFGAGAVDILPASRHQLDKSINVLRVKQYEVRIEGHTDNIPVGSGHVFKSNMELSSMRASRIAQFMIDEYRYPGALISSAGFGESRPIADNATTEGRNKNRRIDIVILNEKERAAEPRPQG